MFADIGTDHAYLPIQLALEGKIKRGYATDINPEPLNRAKANIKKYGLEDRIDCILCNGLEGLSGKEITDIAICGMGGKLICDIIGAAEFIRQRSVRMIIQPMTDQAYVREFLLKSGFDITGESLSLSEGKLYQCICAKFDGVARYYNEIELELGRFNIETNRSGLYYLLLEKKIKNEKKKIEGKRESGADTAQDEARLARYLELYESKDDFII